MGGVLLWVGDLSVCDLKKKGGGNLKLWIPVWIGCFFLWYSITYLI